jgi:hypothetical protein
LEHLQARENFREINAYERITMEVFVWGSTSGPRGSEQGTLPRSYEQVDGLSVKF